MKRVMEKNRRRSKRKRRVRGRISGTSARPRLSVFRSNKNVYVQAIDDEGSRTIASASSISGGMKGLKANVEDGQKIGEAIGKELVGLKITEAVFDRNGYLYHGVVKSIAEGARKAGVKF
ncbi:MAG: 50S ribosomal protein L18 [Spirochaeta sp.]|jgi:large subunit ribosomal protein L18|nr:50S ribosomal protein L18 [Spirochaeta sp.]